MIDIDELLQARPQLHRDGQGGWTSWALPDDVLRLIARTVHGRSSTLETGLGLSTLVFALAGTRHTAIAHHADEVRRVRRHAATLGLSLDRVTLINDRSEWALARLPATPLDLVLIDGRHAFPSPFVDWFFTVDRLRIGGLMMVDDIHLKTGRILREFMAADHRFELLAELGNTVAFTKLATDINLFEFDRQPWMLHD